MVAIALHRVRFDLGGGAILDIESVQGRGKCAPLSTLPVPQLLAVEIEVDQAVSLSGTLPPMRWCEVGELFERFQLREDSEYFIDITVPLKKAEAEARARAHPAWPFDPKLAAVFKRDPVRRWREQEEVPGHPETTIPGRLRLRSHAGVITFSTEFGPGVLAEVACKKLQYFEEFKVLLDSLAEKAAELLLSYDSPIGLNFSIGQTASNDSALHFLLRWVMSADNLPLAVSEILFAPHVKLVESISTTLIEEIEEPDVEVLSEGLDYETLARGGPLSRLFGGYTPRELPHREVHESVDTAENRYAKAFLEECRMIATRLETRMLARKKRIAAREAKLWGQQLDQALQQDLWKGVGPRGATPSNSQVLQERRGYKELLACDMALRMSLALPWQEGAELADGLRGDVRPVNDIYEYWCFFTLRDILLSCCTELREGSSIVSVERDGLRVRLVKGRRSECRFIYHSTHGDVHVSLFYNRRFQRAKRAASTWIGSYTANFDPDFSIALARSANPGLRHWLHFDAKYRLERREATELFDADASDVNLVDKRDSTYEDELERIHKQDDLFKMHTYRDGILGSRGAYILFPGDEAGGKLQSKGQNFFVRHPTAFSGSPAYLVPSVGAFSLTPKGDPSQASAIRDILVASLELISSRDAYKEEEGYF